jgi:hypothetical protein
MSQKNVVDKKIFMTSTLPAYPIKLFALVIFTELTLILWYKTFWVRNLRFYVKSSVCLWQAFKPIVTNTLA